MNSVKNKSSLEEFLSLSKYLSNKGLNEVNCMFVKLATELGLFSVLNELFRLKRVKCYEDFVSRFDIFQEIFDNLDETHNGMLWLKYNYNSILKDNK